MLLNRLEEESIRQRNAFRQEAAQLREEIQRKSEAQEKLLIEAEEKTTRKLQIAIEEEKRAKSKVEAEEATNKRRSLTANLVATQHVRSVVQINEVRIIHFLCLDDG